MDPLPTRGSSPVRERHPEVTGGSERKQINQLTPKQLADGYYIGISRRTISEAEPRPSLVLSRCMSRCRMRSNTKSEFPRRRVL